MVSAPEKTVLLGSEDDENLRQSLNEVVQRLGAELVNHECSDGAYERVEAEIGSKRLVIDAKTNEGISLFGPNDLVDEIHGMVKTRLATARA